VLYVIIQHKYFAIAGMVTIMASTACKYALSQTYYMA